jgi:hypothetical protein
VLAVLVAQMVLLAEVAAAPPQDKGKPPKKDTSPGKAPAVKLGLSINDPKACQGYTLLAPMMATKTYLIDMQGKVVRTWDSDCTPASTAYLLESGHLLRPGTIREGKAPWTNGPASGGRVQKFSWDGKVVWDFKFTKENLHPHHDITALPNGNILMIMWDKKSAKEAIAAGRRPESVRDHLLPDCVLEIRPTGKTTGEVVWEWHLWDHLVQDHDSSKANYGKVADHPELVDLNFGKDELIALMAKKDGQDKLKSIGYLGGGFGGRIDADWTHCNAVAYNAELDQIVLSVHSFSEIWIIDHSTTTAEAASHKGGRSGKGGDLLYRWGNPRAYRAGTKSDQRLFSQHSAHWIPKGFSGAGHLLVFNNGSRRPDGNYSSVDELVLPVDAKGNYTLITGKAYGPDKAHWSYSAPKKNNFFSMLISGAQRLPNGNTLVCSGVNGTLFEVTPDKNMVWKYINPVKGGPGPGGFGFPPPGGPGGPPPGGPGFPPLGGPGFPRPGGPGGIGGPPRAGELLPGFFQMILKMTDEQRKELDGFQKEVTGKLEKILTEDQRKQFKELRPGFGPGGFGAPPKPGQLFSPFLETRLKLTGDQKKQVGELQKAADAKLVKLLDADQKKQLKSMQAGGFRPGGFGPPGFGPPGFGPGGPGGPGGFGPPGGTSLFRAYRYTVDYPGLRGRDLTPGKTIEELQAPKK